MGKRAIEVSSQLWQQICTVGWRAGDKSIIECVKGMPENADFCDVNVSDHVITFIFEHPDWPDAASGCDIPVLDIVHWHYYNGARKAAEAVMARYGGAGGQVRYEARPVTVEELAEIIRVALEDCKE